MTRRLPAVRRVSAEIALGLLVVAGLCLYWRGHRELDLMYGELWSYLAACNPYGREAFWQLTQGELIQTAFIGLRGKCDFDPLWGRMPTLLALSLALVGAAYARIRVRTRAERFFLAAALLSAPLALAAAHHARPYAFWLLGGTFVWLYSDVARLVWPRALTNTAAALATPFNVPVWGGALAVLWWRRGAARRGLALEGLLLVAVTMIEVWVLAGPARELMQAWSYHTGFSGRIGKLLAGNLWDFFLFRPDTLGWAFACTVSLACLRGASRRLSAALMLAVAALGYIIAVSWFEPRFSLRLLLAMYPLIAGIAIAGARGFGVGAIMVMSAVVVLQLVRVFGHFFTQVPELYWGLDVRVPAREVIARLGPGDVVASNWPWLLDQALLPIAAHREVEIWQLPATGGWHTTSARAYGKHGDVPMPLRPERLELLAAAPWAKIRSVQRVGWDAFLDKTRTTMSQGRRVFVLGIGSHSRLICPYICRTLFEQSVSPRPLWLVDGEATGTKARRAAFCKGRRGGVALAEQQMGEWLFWPVAAGHPATTTGPPVRRRLTKRLCPEVALN